MTLRYLAALAIPLLSASASPSAGEGTAQTSLASIQISPIARQQHAPSAWQTLYDYSGGETLPPGTRITATGKWIAPIVRKDGSGVTFSLPPFPQQPQSGQRLDIGFAVERPIPNYPTRITIQYASRRDQSIREDYAWWSPFILTTASNQQNIFSSQLRGLAVENEEKLPIHAVGDNTLVISLDGKGQISLLANGNDASSLLKTDCLASGGALADAGAMLLPGFAIHNSLAQLAGDKGDWFTVHSFKIEQLRVSPELSAVAAINLQVPGKDPIRITIEVVDDKNNSLGYVLRDAVTSPGNYQLYWEGINQNQSRLKNTTWVAQGNYSFHLTTSKVKVTYAGEPNNSTPKYNTISYGMTACTALSMTPPGTTANAEWNVSSRDTRQFDLNDSVQLLCTGYDAKAGQWICADGTVVHTKAGNGFMQSGRGLTLTPPDSADPLNPQKQFYIASTAIMGGYGITSCSLPKTNQNPVVKSFTSKDWNRANPGFLPYKVHLGQFPIMLGRQHSLLFLTRASGGVPQHAEWIFRNVRLYEEGSPDPGSIVFDPAKFAARSQVNTVPVPTISSGSVSVADGGHSVHLTNAIPVAYPFEYIITPRTIMAFDVNVIDQSDCGLSNGIGLSSDPAATDDDVRHCINFLGQITDATPQFGLFNPALGAYAYPQYQANTLYTDTVPLPPVAPNPDFETCFLWQPGYYGVKASDDGKLLFACNNSDNRLEVRDLATSGDLICKIPIDHPMFVTWSPDGAEGAPQGVRYVYVDSPKEGILRIPWKGADNTFGRPEILAPSTEFAYPRGITYSAVDERLFVCDCFNLDRSKIANQLVVIDPRTGKVLSRFGRSGGVDPRTGGTMADDVFTCPLNIEADSKGALWINDYYSGEVRKYHFNSSSSQFGLEMRVLGPNYTNASHFYWMPGDPPTRVWTIGNFFVRNEADLDSDGRFVNQRSTSATYLPSQVDPLRPFAHFEQIGARKLGVFPNQVFEQLGDGWKPACKFGSNAGEAAEKAGLLAKSGQPPTPLDDAIAASGDKDWARRCWAWSDLNGDGKTDYSPNNPEFQIAFNSTIAFDDYIPSTGFLRPEDGAFIHTVPNGLVVIRPEIVGHKLLYTWKGATVVSRATSEKASDVVAQDNRYYVLTSSTERHDVGDNVVSKIECYDEKGSLLWIRDHDDYSLVCLQPLGQGLISIMDRGGSTGDGPVLIRTSDGDLVTQIFCQETSDCWSNGVLRTDADTAYIGLVQTYKVTGLSTVRSAIANVSLPGGGP